MTEFVGRAEVARFTLMFWSPLIIFWAEPKTGLPAWNNRRVNRHPTRGNELVKISSTGGTILAKPTHPTLNPR